MPCASGGGAPLQCPMQSLEPSRVRSDVPRVVSMVPAGTDISAALGAPGAGERIVARMRRRIETGRRRTAGIAADGRPRVLP